MTKQYVRVSDIMQDEGSTLGLLEAHARGCKKQIPVTKLDLLNRTALRARARPTRRVFDWTAGRLLDSLDARWNPLTK